MMRRRFSIVGRKHVLFALMAMMRDWMDSKIHWMTWPDMTGEGNSHIRRDLLYVCIKNPHYNAMRSCTWNWNGYRAINSAVPRENGGRAFKPSSSGKWKCVCTICYFCARAEAPENHTIDIKLCKFWTLICYCNSAWVPWRRMQSEAFHYLFN